MKRTEIESNFTTDSNRKKSESFLNSYEFNCVIEIINRKLLYL